MQQLEENLGAFDVELSPEVLEAIDDVHRQQRNPALQD
jgi:aryl-alcohol dehydrogenase-like predicted oxidoreductase